MRRLYKDRTKTPTGNTLWRNPTDRTLRIPFWLDSNHEKTIVKVQPGGTVSFPSKYDDSMARICKFLVPADGPETAPESPAHEVAPAPTMPAAAPAADEPVAADPPPAPKPTRTRKRRSRKTAKTD